MVRALWHVQEKTKTEKKKKLKNKQKRKKIALPRLWNFLAASEKQTKKTKTCRQFPSCTCTTIRRVPLSSLSEGPMQGRDCPSLALGFKSLATRWGMCPFKLRCPNRKITIATISNRDRSQCHAEGGATKGGVSKCEQTQTNADKR